MAREIELKLAIAPEQATGVWEVLRHYLQRKPSAHRLFTAYYDTPDGHLKKRGVALRLRRQNGHWVQTVKSQGSTSGGLHQRAEHETEVAAQLPSFPAMADAGFGEFLADREVRDALGVVFTTEFNRSSALVEPAAGTVVEVALDRGMIAAGDRRDPICEIEIELKEGHAGALFDLALELAQTLPVRLDNRSKAERGYALASGIKPSPVKAQPSRLAAEMSVEQAFVTLAFDCLAHLQANERGLLAGRNPEYLHQARVAIRRLRSLFRTFEAIVPKNRFAGLPEQLQAIGRILGTARNFDVFIGETLARADAGTYAGMAVLRRRAQTARRHANRAARAVLVARDYTSLMLQLAAALNDPCTDRDPSQQVAAAMPLHVFAAETLSRRHGRVKKRGRRLEQLAFEDLHRLRIAIKRLRYSIDFFEPLAPKKARDGLSMLSDLQDLLGRLNDDATAWKLLDALAAEDAAAEFQQAVGFVRGWTGRDGEQCRSLLGNAWKQFGKLDLWWR